MSLSRRQLLCTAAAAAIAPSLPARAAIGDLTGTTLVSLAGTTAHVGEFISFAPIGGLASIRIGMVDHPRNRMDGK